MPPWLLLVAILVGCHPSDRFAVDGSVAWNGQPLGDGVLTLTPTQGGSTSGALIEGGVFAIDNSPGVRSGSYRVQIESWETAETMVQELDNEGPMRNRVQVIPARYNLDSKLIIDVATGHTHFEFELDNE